MPARDYSVPQPPRPSFTRSSLEPPTEQSSRISARRVIRMQVQTDLYLGLDSHPTHKLIPCSTVYEVKDRSKPSISSF